MEVSSSLEGYVDPSSLCSEGASDECPIPRASGGESPWLSLTGTDLSGRGSSSLSEISSLSEDLSSDDSDETYQLTESTESSGSRENSGTRTRRRCLRRRQSLNSYSHPLVLFDFDSPRNPVPLGPNDVVKHVRGLTAGDANPLPSDFGQWRPYEVPTEEDGAAKYGCRLCGKLNVQEKGCKSRICFALKSWSAKAADGRLHSQASACFSMAFEYLSGEYVERERVIDHQDGTLPAIPKTVKLLDKAKRQKLPKAFTDCFYRMFPEELRGGHAFVEALRLSTVTQDLLALLIPCAFLMRLDLQRRKCAKSKGIGRNELYRAFGPLRAFRTRNMVRAMIERFGCPSAFLTVTMPHDTRSPIHTGRFAFAMKTWLSAFENKVLKNGTMPLYRLTEFGPGASSPHFHYLLWNPKFRSWYPTYREHLRLDAKTCQKPGPCSHVCAERWTLYGPNDAPLSSCPPHKPRFVWVPPRKEHECGLSPLPPSDISDHLKFHHNYQRVADPYPLINYLGGVTETSTGGVKSVEELYWDITNARHYFKPHAPVMTSVRESYGSLRRCIPGDRDKIPLVYMRPLDLLDASLKPYRRQFLTEVQATAKFSTSGKLMEPRGSREDLEPVSTSSASGIPLARSSRPCLTAESPAEALGRRYRTISEHYHMLRPAFYFCQKPPPLFRPAAVNYYNDTLSVENFNLERLLILCVENDQRRFRVCLSLSRQWVKSSTTLIGLSHWIPRDFYVTLQKADRALRKSRDSRALAVSIVASDLQSVQFLRRLQRLIDRKVQILLVTKELTKLPTCLSNWSVRVDNGVEEFPWKQHRRKPIHWGGSTIERSPLTRREVTVPPLHWCIDVGPYDSAPLGRETWIWETHRYAVGEQVCLQYPLPYYPVRVGAIGMIKKIVGRRECIASHPVRCWHAADEFCSFRARIEAVCHLVVNFEEISEDVVVKRHHMKTGEAQFPLVPLSNLPETLREGGVLDLEPRRS